MRPNELQYESFLIGTISSLPARNPPCSLEGEEKPYAESGVLDTFELVRIQHVHRLDAGPGPCAEAEKDSPGTASQPLRNANRERDRAENPRDTAIPCYRASGFNSYRSGACEVEWIFKLSPAGLLPRLDIFSQMTGSGFCRVAARPGITSGFIREFCALGQ